MLKKVPAPFEVAIESDRQYLLKPMDLITGQKRLKSRAAAKSANRDIPLLNAKNVTFHCALLPKTIVLKPSTPSENAPFLYTREANVVFLQHGLKLTILNKSCKKKFVRQ